ncbi:MAG: hypothetical protein WCC92_02925 [Candidatus Korobacteraceae bacterium]
MNGKGSAAQDVRDYVRKQYIEPARRKGQKHVRIVAGDVHRALNLHNRVPNVCTALTSKILLQENHLVIEEREGPPSGLGTRMTYTYRFLEPDDQCEAPPEAHTFEKLHGLLSEALRSLGGGEAFLRKERSSFYGHDEAAKK